MTLALFMRYWCQSTDKRFSDPPPQYNQEPLVVKEKVVGLPDVLRVNTEHACRIVYNSLTLLVGRQEGHPVYKKTEYWFVDDDLTGALHILQLQLSTPPPSSFSAIESRMEIFWYCWAPIQEILDLSNLGINWQLH